MHESRLNINSFQGCFIGGAIGEGLGSESKHMVDASNKEFHYEGLIQLAIFTSEGLLRSLNKDKKIGNVDMLTKFVYDSYQRWYQTQKETYQNVTANDDNKGWLFLRKELYRISNNIKNIQKVLIKSPHKITTSIKTEYADYEGMLPQFPVGLLFSKKPETAFFLASKFCAMTHSERDTMLCAGFFSMLTAYLAEGFDLTEAIQYGIEELKKQEHADKVIASILDALYFIDEIDGETEVSMNQSIDDFVAHFHDSRLGKDILTYALFCTLKFQDDFSEAIRLALRYKPAPDAVAMFVGVLLGLIYGKSNIPSEWMAQLVEKEVIEIISIDLLIGAKGDAQAFNKNWKEKYPDIN